MRGNKGGQNSGSEELARQVALSQKEWIWDPDQKKKKKKDSFLVLKGLSLFLYYQTELRIKRGGQIRLCFIYTSINTSLSLEKLVFDLNEWLNPASELVPRITYTAEVWMKFHLGHWEKDRMMWPDLDVWSTVSTQSPVPILPLPPWNLIFNVTADQDLLKGGLSREFLFLCLRSNGNFPDPHWGIAEKVPYSRPSRPNCCTLRAC